MDIFVGDIYDLHEENITLKQHIEGLEQAFEKLQFKNDQLEEELQQAHLQIYQLRYTDQTNESMINLCEKELNRLIGIIAQKELQNENHKKKILELSDKLKERSQTIPF